MEAHPLLPILSPCRSFPGPQWMRPRPVTWALSRCFAPVPRGLRRALVARRTLAGRADPLPVAEDILGVMV